MISFVIDEHAERSRAFDTLVAKYYTEFWKTAPADLQAAFLAGCEIEYGSEQTPTGLRITARTKNKVGVRRENGQITVYEQR
jgi:hypothetical protein